MTSLLTNTAAMTALTTLKGINQQLDATSNRVSTGQKVSAASDNAAYWSIATTVRTDNASLSAVKDSLGLGSSAVDTAYNGLNSVLSDLQNMRAKLQTALQPGVDRAKVQVEIAAIQNKMKSTADSSISSGQNWLSVNSASTNTAYQATQNVVAGFSRDPSGTINFSKVSIEVSNIKLYDINATNVTTDATEAKVVGSTALTGTTAFTSGTMNFLATSGTAPALTTKQVNFTVALKDGSSATIQLDKNTLASRAKDLAKVTSDELLDAINNQISASGASSLGGKVTASLDSSGRLTFQTTASGANAQVTVFNNAATSAAFALADIGFGSATGNAASAAVVSADANYTAVNLSLGAKITAATNFVAGDYSAGLTFSVNDGTKTTNVVLAAGDFTTPASVTAADFVAAVNAKLTADNSAATVTLSGSKLVFQAATGGSVGVSGDDTDLVAMGFDTGVSATAVAGKTFTINDGSGAKTITLTAADYTALTAPTSGVNGSAAVNGADMASIINAKLQAAGVNAKVDYNATSATKLTFSSTATGTGATVTLGGSDLASLGFTATTTDTGGAALNAFMGYGTNSGTTTGQGILDSSIGAYSAAGAGSYSIANVDISKLVGTSGDTDLSAIITAVDKAIAKVTDAGTKLGASKTQIDGQKSFVDTLMKANDRTIGTLVDADIEEESTKLKALQTQQQLAVQALSIANSSSQNILSLFR